MHIAVPHRLGKKEAKNKITQGLNEHRGQLMQHAKIEKEEWVGDTLNFAVELQGKKITGTLEVTDEQYVLDATLPLLWRMFEGRIEREIHKQVEELSK